MKSFYDKRFKNFVAFKRIFINIHKNSKISIKKRFFFNRYWFKKDPFLSFLFLGYNSELIVKDKFSIFSGARIVVNDNSLLEFGSGYINHNVSINCSCSIKIGYNVAISENVVIRDSDNHNLKSDKKHSKTQPIVIGDKVWVGMNVIILKGVTIGNNSVIAAGSLVNKDVPANCIVGGVPAMVLKTNISWD